HRTRAQGRGASARNAALHGLVHALHDRVARARRRRRRRDVGGGEDARVPASGGLPVGDHEAARARYTEQLVCREEVAEAPASRGERPPDASEDSRRTPLLHALVIAQDGTTSWLRMAIRAGRRSYALS